MTQSRLANGVYELPIIIESNDPLAQTTNLPTTLTVTGQEAGLNVSEDLLLFENVFIGETKEEFITITNTGLAPLEITSITSDNEEFSTAESSVIVPANATYQLAILYAPNSEGNSNGTITLINSVGEPVEILVNGVGVAPPVAVLSPATATISLKRRESGSTVITLSNDGKAPLRYSFDNIPLATQGDDSFASFITDITPDAGLIAPGASKAITLAIDTAGLDAGTYTNELTVTSNSPDKESSTIIVELTVLPIPTIVRFDLINATTNQVVGALENGATIDLADFPTNSFNIVAVPGQLAFGSVLFDFNGVENFSSENRAPYALAGNIGPRFNSLELPLGDNVVTAKPYTGFSGRGTLGESLTVTFNVIDSSAPRITGLSLVNADTDEILGELTEDLIVNLATLGTSNLNVVAIGGELSLSSIIFDLNGRTNFRTERVAPYALAGNIGSDYLPLQLPLGANTITVTPTANGVRGASRTVNFEVISGTPAAKGAITSSTKVFPNPVISEAVVDLGDLNVSDISASVSNLLGVLILKTSDFDFDQSGKGRINMSGMNSGTYILQIMDKTTGDISRFTLIKK